MRYLVLGAGVAGLSTAFHLPRDSTAVLEAEAEVGGVCRSVAQGEFLFDRTGHFLHLRDPRSRRLVQRLLPGRLARHVRHAAICISKSYIPHPFQGHLGWLPPELRRDCLIGFVEACARRDDPRADPAPNLLQWFRRVFGDGITQHFLEPQNRKTYCCELTELDSGWAASYVPQPSIGQVIDGAFLRDASAAVGYNSEFFYPPEGGIQILPQALATQLESVHCGRRVVAVDAISREVTCANGGAYSYGTLISTLPLKVLVAMTSGLPEAIYAAAAALRSVDVLDIRLGIAGGVQLPYQWIYFPEPQFPFARVVIPSNVSPALAPHGCSAIQVEVNCRSGMPLDEARMIAETITAIEELGIVAAGAKILSATAERIACAYVVHDHHRKRTLPHILTALRERGIHSVGRYGGWGYGGMESAILEGIEVAEALSHPAH